MTESGGIGELVTSMVVRSLVEDDDVMDDKNCGVVG